MENSSKLHILETIKRKGRIGLNRLCDETGLAKTTLREHLTQLERDGLVQREYLRAGPGRPGLHYELTLAGHRRFPSEERELLGDLLLFLKSEGREELLRSFFEQFWSKRVERARSRMNEAATESGGIPDEQLPALCDVLEQEGFMPECMDDQRQGAFVIKECNCPFQSVIGKTRLPCELEIAFYRKLFGGEVTRTSYIPDGDYSCSYRIDRPDN